MDLSINKTRKKGLVIRIVIASLLLVASLFAFIFPTTILVSGTTNNSNSNKLRMKPVFVLKNTNVMITEFINEEDTDIRGIALYLRYFLDGEESNTCNLPESSKLIYGIFLNDEEVSTISNSISIRELLLPNRASDKVINSLYFDGSSINKGDKVKIVFSLKNVPEEVQLKFYGINYKEDEERDNMYFLHSDLKDVSVPIYRFLVEGNDYSLALLLSLITFISFLAIVLYINGEKHD